MSDTFAALTLATRRARLTTRSYVLLLKPRVMSLVVFTAAVGMIVAPRGQVPWLPLSSCC